MTAAETKNCQSCKADFVIEPEDFDFYQKMAVPPPTFCPTCRLVRRMTFRNERNLYKRACDLCKQDKIMMYPEGTPFPVYCRPCWWSDGWDAKSYAREYDPGRSFFGQFRDLLHAVPRSGTINQGNIVNSDYTNRVTDPKNCYLVFGSTVVEDSRYCSWANDAKQCADCYAAQKSELCYDCIDCFQCSRLLYSQECNSCTDSYFLYNCRNLQNCFGCVNLRNKQYCIWNKQYTKEEYHKIIAGYGLGNRTAVEAAWAKLEALKKGFIVPWMISRHNQNASGNWIENSKNVARSFTCNNVEDGKYAVSVFSSKDVMDHTHWGNNSERTYECVSVGIQCAGVKFSNECWDQTLEAEYSMNCHSSRNLFGCIGLRKAAHSVLNKEYPEAEYRQMVTRIKEDMDKNPYADRKGRVYRYGEFFPSELSPHAYNETLAQEFFPLSREQAEAAGHAWKENEARNYQVTLSAEQVPETIAEASDDMLKEVVGCAHGGGCNHRCTTAFRVIPEELAFYRQLQIPLPQLCPNCRHFERLAKRNPLKLWLRQCQCSGQSSENGAYQNLSPAHALHGADEQCSNEFETSYAPDRPEIVYCEQCYTAEIA